MFYMSSYIVFIGYCLHTRCVLIFQTYITNCIVPSDLGVPNSGKCQSHFQVSFCMSLLIALILHCWLTSSSTTCLFFSGIGYGLPQNGIASFFNWIPTSLPVYFPCFPLNTFLNSFRVEKIRARLSPFRCLQCFSTSSDRSGVLYSATFNASVTINSPIIPTTSFLFWIGTWFVFVPSLDCVDSFSLCASLDTHVVIHSLVQQPLGTILIDS